MDKTSQTLAALAAIGGVVGLGQLFASTEKLTARVVVGRAIASAGLGAASATVLIWLPNLPFVAQCGLAAALASLGTSGLERLLQRVVGIK